MTYYHKIPALLIIGWLAIARLAGQPPSFSFSPNNQSGTLIGQAQLDGLPADGADWIAAFDSLGNCAGAAAIILNGGIAYLNLPIYGNDPNTPADEGMDPGERFFLYLWDASTHEVIPYGTPCDNMGFSGWANNNGAPMLGYNDPNTVYQFEVPLPPTATWSALPAVCANAGPVALTEGTPVGGTYVGPGVSAGSFDPNLVGPGSYTLQYIYTDPSVCLSDTAQANITVEAVPQATLAAFNPVCVNASAIPLAGGLPSGGSYSGPGVSGGSFDPAVAGVGTHVIVYTVSNAAGCTDSATQVITVEAVPQATLAAFNPVCVNASAIPLAGGLPSGGSYSGPGVSGGSFDPAVAGVGTHVIVYTVSNAAGCTDSATQVITVEAVPAAPSVQINGDTLFTQVSGMHQWYLDGQPINGAADSLWVAQQDGMYSVVVISPAGCVSDPSDEVSVVVSSMVKQESARLRVFPNPAEEQVHVWVSDLPVGLYKWVVVDAKGRRIAEGQRQQRPQDSLWQLAISDWPSGIFFITLQALNGSRWHARIIRL